MSKTIISPAFMFYARYLMDGFFALIAIKIMYEFMYLSMYVPHELKTVT
jgi:hypothetical protein